MTRPTMKSHTPITRPNSKEANQDKVVFQESAQAKKNERDSQASINDVLRALESLNLDMPEVHKTLDDIQQNYSANETNFFLAAVLLFAKKHVLTSESFNFLKQSMNIIEYVFNFISTLFNNDLLSGFNLGKFFELPILKSLNAIFKVLSKEEEGSLNQETYEEVLSTINSMSEDFISRDIAEPVLKEVTSALLDIAKNGVSSEAAIDAVKAHPAPQIIAKAIISLKKQGGELTQSVLDKLKNSDELNDPKLMVDGVINFVKSELSKAPEESVLSYAAQEVSKAAISSVSSSLSAMPQKIWDAGVSSVASMFSFFKPAKVEKSENLDNADILMTKENEEENVRSYEI